MATSVVRRSAARSAGSGAADAAAAASEEVEEPPVTAEDGLEVCEAFFSENSMVEQQKASFEQFLNFDLQDRIDKLPAVHILCNGQTFNGGARVKRVVVEFGKVVIAQPTNVEQDQASTALWPNEARLRGLDYSYAVYVDVDKRVVMQDVGADGQDEEHVEQFSKVFIGYIPAMVGCGHCRLVGLNTKERADVKECAHDPGGYFLVQGSERVVVAQDKMASNRIHVFLKDKVGHFSHVAETRSVEANGRCVSTVAVKLSRPQKRARTRDKEPHTPPYVVVSLPYVRGHVSLRVVMLALGLESARDVLQCVGVTVDDLERCELLWPTLNRRHQDDGDGMTTQDAALELIAEHCCSVGMQPHKKIESVKRLLARDFLPHVGTREGLEKLKSAHIGRMTRALLDVAIGVTPPVDRDHLGNKRVDLVGKLMTDLLTQALTKQAKDLKMYCQRQADKGHPVDIVKGMNHNTLTKTFRYALATGNWCMQKAAPGSVRAGVSQVANRQTLVATKSHLRRINTPFGRAGKLAKPRQLHNTHWGMICPAETPEGQAVGLVKNMALMASVSSDVHVEGLDLFLRTYGMEALDEMDGMGRAHEDTKVIVNGAWVGVHRDAAGLADTLRTLRRRGELELDVGIVLHAYPRRELEIDTEYGRLLRPLLVVENQRVRLRKSDIEAAGRQARPWSWLLTSGAVELVGVEEEEVLLIAMGYADVREDNRTYRYTHCEIHPSMILGVSASIIPFPDHNQSPRNTYQSAMGKQAMGWYSSAFQWRFDTHAHLLMYAQKALAASRAAKWALFDEFPAGINATVAIACYGGYNQEDSVIMNQSSIDRGFFRSYHFHSYRAEPDAKKGERFERSDRKDMPGRKRANYDKLDEDGLPRPGTRMTEDDVMFGITGESSEPGQEGERVDRSIMGRKKTNGIVDSVMVTESADGNPLAKVALRSVNVPQIGDKFASRHGQKGTIGLTMRQEDMPFDRLGITPDVILNPHAIPSRMTIGHLVECLLSKVAALTGDQGDATPFTTVTVDDISRILAKFGFQKRGFDVMYSGHTGRRLEAAIFLGPTFYQRLKHMVDDKIHARARGPITNLTRQPVEGRSRDGGGRMGEMERDCLVSHGGALTIRESFMDRSDGAVFSVCNKCGLFSIWKKSKNRIVCPNRKCKNTTDHSLVELPNACKLLFQELMSMNIAPRAFTATA
jgi:DNA-directed RNA polymerase II subunit RPB2